MQGWCEHVGGLGPPFPLCEICAPKVPEHLCVPDMGKRFNQAKEPGGVYYVAPVVEQLEYWGTAEDSYRQLMAAHVIRQLAKRVPPQPLRIFCDMDGTIVDQAGPRYDLMQWKGGGQAIWQRIAPHKPIILSQIRDERYGEIAAQKMIWVKRELGVGVPCIFTPDSVGKAPFCTPGAILIDDAATTVQAWHAAGGNGILRRDTQAVLNALHAAGA